MVEEYEIRFMELVKYVSYMDSDQRQAERFIYGLNPRIRAMVRMWKPSLLHIIFVIPMIVNDVNLSIAFRGVTVA
jgi:hypothetical protein